MMRPAEPGALHRGAGPGSLPVATPWPQHCPAVSCSARSARRRLHGVLPVLFRGILKRQLCTKESRKEGRRLREEDRVTGPSTGLRAVVSLGPRCTKQLEGRERLGDFQGMLSPGEGKVALLSSPQSPEPSASPPTAGQRHSAPGYTALHLLPTLPCWSWPDATGDHTKSHEQSQTLGACVVTQVAHSTAQPVPETSPVVFSLVLAAHPGLMVGAQIWTVIGVGGAIPSPQVKVLSRAAWGLPISWTEQPHPLTWPSLYLARRSGTGPPAGSACPP